jgi:glycosyltransferase involved in cell wall biosynthesis
VLSTRDFRGTANRGKLDILNAYFGVLHLIKLTWMLVCKRPDLIYTTICRNAMWAFFRDSLFIHLSSLFGVRVVGHLHGSYFNELYQKQCRLIRWYIRKTLAKVNDVIILGESLRYNFDGLIPQDHVHVVYNGIDGTPYWERRQQNLAEITDDETSPIIVLFVGVLKKSKGYHVLLQSLPQILTHRKDIKLLFAGEWFTEAEKEESFAFLREYNLEEHVEFLGIIRGEQKYQHFSKSDIFAFPTSYIEGHPIVIVEAMASGLPVISTNRGSIPEYVIDNQTGFIIPENSPKDLAEKIVQLIEDKDLRSEISSRCREMFENRFTQHHFVNGVVDVWKIALNSK